MCEANAHDTRTWNGWMNDLGRLNYSSMLMLYVQNHFSDQEHRWNAIKHLRSRTLVKSEMKKIIIFCIVWHMVSDWQTCNGNGNANSLVHIISLMSFVPKTKYIVVIAVRKFKCNWNSYEMKRSKTHYKITCLIEF